MFLELTEKTIDGLFIFVENFNVFIPKRLNVEISSSVGQNVKRNWGLSTALRENVYSAKTDMKLQTFTLNLSVVLQKFTWLTCIVPQWCAQTF